MKLDPFTRLLFRAVVFDSMAERLFPFSCRAQKVMRRGIVCCQELTVGSLCQFHVFEARLKEDTAGSNASATGWARIPEEMVGFRRIGEANTGST